jgi:hypothetical protein
VSSHAKGPGSVGTSDSLAREGRGADDGGMKRLIAGPLWFISFALMYELLWSLTGVPRVVGPVIALVVGVTVWIDPMHWFWPAPDRSTAAMPPSALQVSAE